MSVANILSVRDSGSNGILSRFLRLSVLLLAFPAVDAMAQVASVSDPTDGLSFTANATAAQWDAAVGLQETFNVACSSVPAGYDCSHGIAQAGFTIPGGILRLTLHDAGGNPVTYSYSFVCYGYNGTYSSQGSVADGFSQGTLTVTGSTATPAPPTVTSISPTSGSPAGGTSVAITGTGFQTLCPTNVNFGGGNGAASVTVNSDASITVTSPRSALGGGGGTGTVDVTVTTAPGDASATSSADRFTYATVPGAPTIGTATAGNAQATVSFTAPASNGGDTITGYKATSSPGGLTGGCSASPCTVTGLTNGTAYTFTVTATNSIGAGAASAASNSVTPIAPQTITFTNPGPRNFDTTPTLTATATSGLTVTFTSTTTSVCTITPGGALTFVAAGTCIINADQGGDAAFLPAPTVSQSFSVNAVLPGAPTIGTATASNGQAIVSFTPPASDGGATITGYTVTSSPGGITGTCTSSPCVVTGLTNGTAYTFTVTATNDVGTGSSSTSSNTVTPRAMPTVTSISPTAGTNAGGTSVTIAGAGFTGATAVNFGTQASISFNVNSDTSMTAISPAGTGVVDVAVTTPAGNSATSPADRFTYITPSYVVDTVNDDDGSNALSNCNAATQGTAKTCSLRDALTLAASAGGAPITFSSAVFAPANTPAQNTVFLQNGTLVVPTNTSVTGPTSGSGAALANLVTVDGGGSANNFSVFTIGEGAAATIAHLTITDGHTNSQGGGISSAGILTVDSCTFANNYAAGYLGTGNGGGGIFQASGTLTVTNSTFVGNSSAPGGAIAVSLGTAAISNSSFSGNTALDAKAGGAIFSNSETSLTIVASTFSNNSAAAGAGVYINGSSSVADSILAGNTGGDCGAGGQSSCPTNGSNGNIVGVAAIALAPLGNYGGATRTMIPLPGSPSICAGTSSPSGDVTLPASDQRGTARPDVDQPGYSTSPCVDAGAVQTHYALVFSTQPPSTVHVGAAPSPTPAVALEENSTAFSSTAYSTLSSVTSFGSVALTDADGVLSGSPVSASIDPATGVANFSSLSFTGVRASDTLDAALNLSPSAATPAITVSAVSNPFAVTPAAASVVLSNLNQTYTGSPLSVTITTAPPNLAVNVTYAGSTTAPTDAGSYAIVATITDPNYSGTATGTLVIAQAAQTLTFAAAPAIAVGGTGQVSAASAAPNSDNPVTYSAAPSSICRISGNVVTGVAAGTCTVTAAQAGNANYSAASATQTIGIGIANSQVTLSASPTSTGAGQTVVLTATVSGQNPTGTVTFNQGTNVLCSEVSVATSGNMATATCSTTALGVGTDNISASYSGDANNTAAVSNVVAVSVSLTPTTMNLTATPNPVTQNQPLTLAVTVSASSPTPTDSIGISRAVLSGWSTGASAASAVAPNGTVNFMDNGNPIGSAGLSNGAASLTISSFGVGTHAITASYAGNGTYAAATAGPINVTVSAASATPTQAAPTLSTWALFLFGVALVLAGGRMLVGMKDGWGR